jgi:putative ABC transport system permease protein
MQLATPRLTGFVLGSFAAVALVLAAVGVYGLLSYVVSRRTREIGIRLALGAERRRVIRLVACNGVILQSPASSPGLPLRSASAR